MFGWHEAAITLSIEQKARWEALLAAAGIAYRIKTLNRRSPSPFGGGSGDAPAPWGNRWRWSMNIAFWSARAIGSAPGGFWRSRSREKGGAAAGRLFCCFVWAGKQIFQWRHFRRILPAVKRF